MATPKEYGLDHDEFRPNQLESIEWAYENVGKQKAMLVEAPTGSGKTALSRALARDYRVISLVRTKILQEENYEALYGFDTLYGKGNYPCVYDNAKRGAMADECAFAEEGMHRCPQFSLCPYAQQRLKAQASNMASLNYAYWLNVYSKWPAANVLVCDEAHELSGLTLEWAGCTITEKERRNWDLPLFPVLRSGGSISIMSKSDPVEDRAIAWLNGAREQIVKAYNYHSRFPDDQEHRVSARKAEMFGKKLRATLDALQASQRDWYIRSGPGVFPSRNESSFGFVCRPLTAKYHFNQYFSDTERDLMLMSATIGDFATFAEELGITDYNELRVPSNWPHETRPVHALDVPRLGQKSPESARKKQAEEIASAIRSCPKDWHGIVHVTSIKEASVLGNRLAKLGLEDRIYVPDRAPTNVMIRKWQERMRKVPGSIIVSWAMWEGYNGLDEKITIAAKVPYPYLGDPYEIERRNYNGKFFLQRAAWQMEQGLGRTRRGRSEDYDTSDEMRGLVAIADGGYKWLRGYFSPHFIESIREKK